MTTVAYKTDDERSKICQQAGATSVQHRWQCRLPGKSPPFKAINTTMELANIYLLLSD